MKANVDEYLKTRQQSSPFLSKLKDKMLLAPNEFASAETRYNVPLINSLVLYVGMQAIHQLQGRTPHTQSSANAFPLAVFSVGAALDIFHTLIMDFDNESRYLFLNKQPHSVAELNLEKERWNIVARVVRLWFIQDYSIGKTPFLMEIVLQDKKDVYSTSEEMEKLKHSRNVSNVMPL